VKFQPQKTVCDLEPPIKSYGQSSERWLGGAISFFSVRTQAKNKKNFYFYFYFYFHVRTDMNFLILLIRFSVRADALMFFLGGWKCEWGFDVGCGRKCFLDQICNRHI
jgi:hypothetical protein